MIPIVLWFVRSFGIKGAIVISGMVPSANANITADPLTEDPLEAASERAG